MSADRLAFYDRPTPPASEVRKVAESYFADEGNKGEGMLWAVIWWAEARLKDKYRTSEFNGGLASTFTSSVRRALDKMTEDGKLVKQPDRGSRREPRYITPSALDAENARAQKALEARIAVEEEWVKVNRSLAELGIYTPGSASDKPQLSLSQWQELLGSVPR